MKSVIPKRYFAPHQHELQTTRMNEEHKAVVAALPVRQIPPFHPAKSRRPCNAQFALPAAPRRQSCLTQNEPRVPRARETLPPLSLAEVRACHRKMRIALSLPQRQSCPTRHARIEPLHEADAAQLAARSTADRKRVTPRMKDETVWLRALRGPERSDENFLWVVLAVAVILSLTTSFGAMGQLAESWAGFVSLVTRCLN